MPQTPRLGKKFSDLHKSAKTIVKIIGKFNKTEIKSQNEYYSWTTKFHQSS